MTNDEYIKEVLKTESIDAEAIGSRLSENFQLVRLLHAAMGMVTEAGELLDVLKKNIFYGKEIDMVNLEEELGDLLWYKSVTISAMNEMGYKTDDEQIMTKNIAKLRARYGENFSEKAALTRNLQKERDTLENNILLCECGYDIKPMPQGNIEGIVIFCPECDRKWIGSGNCWEEIEKVDGPKS